MRNIRKLVTAEEAVRLVKDGDWVDYSQTCSFPEAPWMPLWPPGRGKLREIKVTTPLP